MKLRFVCLANSIKEGGRCLAGIVLNGDDIAYAGDKPLWIRPVCPENQHGQISFFYAFGIQLLDIVEITVGRAVPADFQVENTTFDVKEMQVVGRYFFPTALLNVLTETDSPTLFGSTSRSVPVDDVHELDYSLTLIRTYRPTFYTVLKGERAKEQLRILFSYHGVTYDLPVTDPEFLEFYRNDASATQNLADVYLTLSLGIAHEGKHYKLVAAVFY
jgi:hypothetical protein